MNNTHTLVCPKCSACKTLLEGEEPREGLLYACGNASCQEAFKLIAIGGTFVTASAGDDEEEVRKIFAGKESLVAPASEALTRSMRDGTVIGTLGGAAISFFDLINIDKNRGVKREADVGDLFRQTLPTEDLMACPCSGCREELKRRNDVSRAKEDAEATSDRLASVPERMAAAAETFKQRNALYGDSYKHFHEHMMTLFPDGLTLKTADEWRRFGILFYAIGKLVRYTNNFSNGGHLDSAHDLGVYAFMLEELTEMGLKEKGN